MQKLERVLAAKSRHFLPIRVSQSLPGFEAYMQMYFFWKKNQNSTKSNQQLP